jgi:tetratricopeptide (TPR) repeat protein
MQLARQKTSALVFFVSPDGLVVTNLHVIEGADSITAVSNKGAIFLFERVVAQPVGVDLEAIRLDPNYAPAYCGRGYAYQEQGNFDKAISDYTEAIRLEPNYAAAYVDRGNIYLRTGNRAEANADFATAKRLEAGQ